MHGPLSRDLAAALEDRLVHDLALTFRRCVRDRHADRLRTCRLDELLARGVPPETDPELAARARRLARRSMRRALAAQVLRLTHGMAGRHAEDLRALAHRLEGPDRIPTETIAAARLLVARGCPPTARTRVAFVRA